MIALDVFGIEHREEWHMAADFTPTKRTIQVDQYTGDTYKETFAPTAGNTCAVLFVQVTPAGLAAAAAKMAELRALPGVSSVMKSWVAEAEAGKVPQVQVRMIVRKDGVPE